jgi:hypothetical protein
LANYILLSTVVTNIAYIDCGVTMLKDVYPEESEPRPICMAPLLASILLLLPLSQPMSYLLQNEQGSMELTKMK